MDERTPWLSVVMPVFQGAAHVAHALRSVAAERVPGIEIVVADDGSTDGTLDVVAGFASELPIRIVHRGGDGRWPAGANRGLAEARGRHATLLFHDDVWLPGRLAAVRTALDQAPDAALVAAPAEFIDHAGRSLGRWGTPFGARDLVLDGPAFAERLLVQNFLAAPAPTFSREAALAAGGLDPDLWYTADWDLWLKLAARGRVVHVGRPLAGFRIHPGAMTLSRRRTAAAFRAQHDAVLARHLPRFPGTSPATAAAARFSIEVNVALAEAAGGAMPGLEALARAAAKLGPGGARRFAQNARLWERVSARVRARLKPPAC